MGHVPVPSLVGNAVWGRVPGRERRIAERTRAGLIRFIVATMVLSLVPVLASATPAEAAPVVRQAGFDLEPIFGGYTGFSNPVAVRFAPDGSVFVAEQNGIVEVFDDIYDATPTQVVDISNEVHGYWDRGLLGMAVDPDFAAGSRYLYTMYTWDTGDQWPILRTGGGATKWGTSCTNPGPWRPG